MGGGGATISLLSMPTLRRLTAIELMSFSLIHDLKSLTAKAADTPADREPVRAAGGGRGWAEGRRGLTLFDKVLVEEAVQDGGRQVAVGQQDAGEHGELVALRLREPF